MKEQKPLKMKVGNHIHSTVQNMDHIYRRFIFHKEKAMQLTCKNKKCRERYPYRFGICPYCGTKPSLYDLAAPWVFGFAVVGWIAYGLWSI
jgi:hypothetical protein